MENFKIPKKTFMTIPQGTYYATIVNLEQVPGEKYGPQVKITFSVGAQTFEQPVNLVGWCSTNYSEKSKLFAWTKAALGAEFDPMAEFEAAPLFGREVLVNVSKKVSATGTEFNKIEACMPLPAQVGPAPEVKTKQQPKQPVQETLTDTPANWPD
jgi:hypothetical protein